METQRARYEPFAWWLTRDFENAIRRLKNCRPGYLRLSGNPAQSKAVRCHKKHRPIGSGN